MTTLKAHWQKLAACAPAAPRPDLRQTQTDWLLDCLRRNAHCAYGAAHDFASIHTIEDFRQRVPLSHYQDVQPSIDRMARGETNLLFSGSPVAFEITSGSSGAGKWIPYSSDSLMDFSRALAPWIGGAARRHAFSGHAYWAISPVMRAVQYTPGGAAVGLPDAAYLGASLAPSFAALSAVDPRVALLDNLGEWQKQTWHGLLHCGDLELISVWSPTFLLALLDALPKHEQALTRQLRDEGEAGRAALRRMRGYLESACTRALWPRLRLVSCWLHGASQAFGAILRQRLPHASFEAKGLLMTEGIVTAPDESGAPVLSAQSGFYEFLADDGQIRLADELAQDACYEVIITTSGGLYRYQTGDRVRCCAVTHADPNRNGWPVLDFLGRTGLCSDLVGEKLTDAFVTDCLADAHCDGGFYMLIPRLDPAAHYVLIVDERDAPPISVESLESLLQRNPQYRYARELGQLQPLRIAPVRQPLTAYLRRLSSQGMRLGDIKPVSLRPETDWLPTFEACIA